MANEKGAEAAGGGHGLQREEEEEKEGREMDWADNLEGVSQLMEKGPPEEDPNETIPAGKNDKPPKPLEGQGGHQGATTRWFQCRHP